MILQPGTLAPNFTLPDQTGVQVSLEDLRDRNVVLVFYPGDFTPVCTAQLTLYNDKLELLQEMNAEVIGISTDSIPRHSAFHAARDLQFRLLCDTKGTVGRLYGAFDEERKTEARALFVIGTDGRIHWSLLSDYDSNPGIDGILTALGELQVREFRHPFKASARS